MIYRQLQEHNDRFNKVRTNLLIGFAYLNLRMTELRPDDFG